LPAALTNGIAVARNQAGHPEASRSLDKLEKALLEKHPRFAEFNGGRLEMKKTGRRFWDDKADNQNGAMVVDKGFYCVRRKSLVTWEDLLGVARSRLCGRSRMTRRRAGYTSTGRSISLNRTRCHDSLTRLDMMLHLASKGFERSRPRAS